MKSLLLILVLVIIQLPRRDSEPVVVLPSNRANITADYGGKYVQLKNAGSQVFLPKIPPRALPSGVRWYVDVVNFGPNEVTIQASDKFEVRLQPKDSVRIVAADSIYEIAH